mmetsp:Transcript_941/g.1136  ORF Transcript_941/g.1136 Transcript_941/m.1136 type:complete len:187 (+) Transcript_941:121-681(+)
MPLRDSRMIGSTFNEYDAHREPLSEKQGLNSSERLLGLKSRRLKGLDTTLDIALLSLSIILVVILTAVVTWFCLQKKRLTRKIREKDEKLDKAKHPEITIMRSRMTGSDDSSKTNDDAFSDVSSIWDSASQKFDQTFFEQREQRILQIQNTHNILTSNSAIQNSPSGDDDIDEDQDRIRNNISIEI